MIRGRHLSSYLNDHLAGSAAGADLFQRASRVHAGSDRGAELAELAEQVREDQARLRAIIGSLGVKENRTKMRLAQLGERAARLKPNARMARRSPLSNLVELEALRIAVAGKAAGWQALRAAAEQDDRLPKDELEQLHARAEEQIERLKAMHLEVAQRLFREGTA